ncbi:MAG: MATE family efflux transporter [Devosia sp.]
MVEQATTPDSGANEVVSSLGWAAEFRASLALAWPLIIAQLAQNLLHTTDVVLLGWLGPQYLAAGTLATAYLMPFQFAGVGVVAAVAGLVAQARGRGDTKAVRRIVRQGFWVAIALSTLLVPVLLSIGPVYRALGQDPRTIALAESYMWAGFWMLYPVLGTMVLRAFLSAFDATRVILVVTVIGVLLNALVAWVLIFGHFGFPRLELRGAAIATGLVSLFMFLAMLGYVLTHRKLKRFHVLARFTKPDWHRFAEILKVGLPIGLTVLAEVGLFSVAAILMGWLGTNEVAAHAVALQLAATAFMVPLGLGMAATVRVGRAAGRGDSEGVRLAGWTNLGLGVGFMALTAMLFLIAPGTLVGIFLDGSRPENAEALMLAATFLGIAGIFQLADGAQVVAAHALRGLSDTRTPMLLAIFGYWFVGLPTAYVLGFVLEMRGVGVWTGMAVGLAFVAVLLVGRFALRDRLGLLQKMAVS